MTTLGAAARETSYLCDRYLILLDFSPKVHHPAFFCYAQNCLKVIANMFSFIALERTEELLYDVDDAGSSLLHLAVSSRILKVSQ